MSEEVPKINWLKLFKKMFDDSITENELIVTYALDFLKKYQILIENTEKRVIYNYFLFLAIDSVLKNLKSAYNKLRNDFERAVQGSKAQQVRWAYCVEITNIIMGLAITSPYVESHFSDNKKKKVCLKMIFLPCFENPQFICQMLDFLLLTFSLSPIMI